MLFGDVVAHLEMQWFIWFYVVWRCGGSFRDVKVHLGLCCLEMWWLIWRCGGLFRRSEGLLVTLKTIEAVIPRSNPAYLTVENSADRQGLLCIL